MKFIEIVCEAADRVNLNKTYLFKLLVVPFLLIVGLGFLQDKASDNLLIISVLWGLNVLVYSILAITIHRVLLLGPASVIGKNIYQWSKRETSFALYLVGFTIIMCFIAFLSTVLGVFGVVIGGGLNLWVFSRWSLVFPAIAVDKDFSFEKSWELTKDHQLLMFLVVLVFPILLNLPLVLLEKLQGFWLIACVLSTFSVVFTISALSIAYKHIVEKTF